MKIKNQLLGPKSLINIMLVSLIVLVSCNEKKEVRKTVPQQIVLEKLTNSPSYSNATLELKALNRDSYVSQDTINFNFDVQNYTLGAQTESILKNELANSKKGQHIHFILNNQPYSAHYTNNFSKNIPNGVHHLVAFLSRSYHESVKNEKSVVVKKLVSGPNAKDTIGLNMEAPTLIYSRPKGKYAGKDAKQILLDFFVLNTALSKDGNKVKATINNQEFILTEWSPYVISGLPEGKATISLALVDATGKHIPGPFNKVTRTIIIEK